MSSQSFEPHPPHRAALLALAFLVLAADPAALRAAGPWPPPRDTPSAKGPETAPGSVPSASRPVVLASAWKSVTRFFENTLNNRRRMIQFAVLGMCLALYIMIWRR